MTNSLWFGGTGNWSDAGDWSPAGVPDGGAANVTINSGFVTVSAGFSIASLALNGFRTTLLIARAGSLALSKGSDFTRSTITGSGKLEVDGIGNVFGGSVNQPTTITGSISATINGVSTFNYLTIGGNATVTNHSTIHEANRVIIGNATGNKATLINAAPSANKPAGGTYLLDGSSSLVAGAAGAHFYNYGTFIKVSGTGASFIGVNFTDTGRIIVTAGTLGFYNTARFSGSVTGRGTLLIQGGLAHNPNPVSQTLNAGANLAVYFVTMAGPSPASPSTPALAADNLTVAANIRCSSVFTENPGATLTIAAGATLTLTGAPRGGRTSSFAGTIRGGGMLVLAGGSQWLTRGIRLSPSAVVISGSDVLTVNAPVTYAGMFTQMKGTTLNVAASAALTFTGPSPTLGGSLIDNGSLVFQADATLAGTTTLNGSAAIIVGNGHTLFITGTLINNGNSTTSLIGEDVSLPRRGRGHISAIADNSGTIEVSSGELDVAGFLTNKGKVLVSAKAILSLARGGKSSAGAFSVASGGMLNFTGGTFTLTNGTSGAAKHPGALRPASSTDTLTGGGLVNLMGGMLELGSSAITIACPFSQYGGSVLDGDGVLTLTDGMSFAGSGGTAVETGTGTTLLKGSTTISANLALDGGRILENASGETLTWTSGDFYVGINPTGTSAGGGTIMNDAGATFDIASNGVIAHGTGTTTFINAGTVTKSNTGKTTIATAVANLSTGVMSVESGVLDIAGAVRGHGTMNIDGGTLELESTLTPNQKVSFTAKGGGLVLADASAFTGSITGFGNNKNDTIDLTNAGFNNITLGYSGDSTQGVLIISDGNLQAQIRMFGDYVLAGFQTSPESGGGGGTVITYVPPPPSHLELAPGH
jgi:hypothetical protein